MTQLEKLTQKLGLSFHDSFEENMRAIEEFVTSHIEEFDLSKPDIEGESKKIYRWNDIALVELKPTMYSFTHNRYGNVEGTDQLRHRFWRVFASEINKGNDVLLSNYIGGVKHNGKTYSIISYENSLPPIEVVWKNYMVGTMKHNLKGVDRHETIYGQPIAYEGRLPKPIVRFDWRNPLPDKDECIPEDFAANYIDTEKAKATARKVSETINDVLGRAGYELIDLCYFMNTSGTTVCSEITPDGMRIRKNKMSYDKDLWRIGKDRETIIDAWTELLKDMEGKYETRAA